MKQKKNRGKSHIKTKTDEKKVEENEGLENREKQRQMRSRSALKSKKPDFQRFEAWRYKRLGSSWRKPKGIDHHMRTKESGCPKHVSIGYRSPKKVRYYHPSGKEEKIVFNLEELEGTDSSKQVVRIAHTVGLRKRMKLLERAEELKLHVVNPGGEEYEIQEQEEAGS